MKRILFGLLCAIAFSANAGLETGTYVGDLVSTNPPGTDPRSQGADHLRLIKSTIQATFPNMSGRVWRSQSKGSVYTVLTTDNLTTIKATAAFTLNFTAAATLGNGFRIAVYASSGDVVLDPNAAETINGVATLTVPSGSNTEVWSDGTNLFATTPIPLSTTGTVGSLVFSVSPTLTGTLTAAAANFSGIVNVSALQTADNANATVIVGRFSAGAPNSYIEPSATSSKVIIRGATSGTDVLAVNPTGVSVTGTLSASGHTTFEGITSTGATGTGNLVYSASPTLSGTTTITTLAVTTIGAHTISGAITYGGVTMNNAVTGTGNMVLSASPTLSGTVGGALTFSGAMTMSSALTYGGVTLTNAVTGTGSMVLSASPTFTGTVTTAALLSTGSVTGRANGTYNLEGVASLYAANTAAPTKYVQLGYDNSQDAGYIHAIHASTAWKNLYVQNVGGTLFLGNANGVSINGALTYGGVTLNNAVTGTGNMVLSASPTLSGTVGGALTFSGALTLSSALTYGGVALSNAVTGTGNMVLSAAPTFTGTTTIATLALTTVGAHTISGAITYGGVTLSNAVTGTGNMVLSASPTLSGTVGGALTFSGALTLSSALTYGGVTLTNAVTGTGNMVLSAAPTFTGAPISTTAAVGTNTTQIATTAFVSAFPQQITNALGADVNLTIAANYFDGPSVAQGTSGTWYASGTVTVTGTAGDTILVKLWDGTTVIASSMMICDATIGSVSISLSGYISSPAANIRLSVRDSTTTTGKIRFNQTGNSKDSVLTAFKVAN